LVFRSGDPLDFKAAPCVAELKAHAPEVFRDEDGDWFISSVEWPHRGVSLAPLAWK
jgi:beta-fructofuranosidase